MNPNFDLLSSLAEIAGVFIGFGALIILSGSAEDDVPEVSMVRQVVAIGLLTLVGALVPIGLAQVGLEGLVLWRVSSAVFFGLIWFSILHPTSRRLIVAQMKTAPRSAAFFWLVLEPPIQVPLILTMLGMFPARASGLFTIAVVVNLVECAQLLAQVTYARAARVRNWRAAGRSPCAVNPQPDPAPIRELEASAPSAANDGSVPLKIRSWARRFASFIK